MSIIVVSSKGIYGDRATVHNGDLVTESVKLFETDRYIMGSVGSPDIHNYLLTDLEKNPELVGNTTFHLNEFAAAEVSIAYLYDKEKDILYEVAPLQKQGTRYGVLKQHAFRPVDDPDEEIVFAVVGSGKSYFFAYYKEHGDVKIAMELTSEYSDECGFGIDFKPFDSDDAEDYESELDMHHER